MIIRFLYWALYHPLSIEDHGWSWTLWGLAFVSQDLLLLTVFLTGGGIILTQQIFKRLSQLNQCLELLEISLLFPTLILHLLSFLGTCATNCFPYDWKHEACPPRRDVRVIHAPHNDQTTKEDKSDCFYHCIDLNGGKIFYKFVLTRFKKIILF